MMLGVEDNVLVIVIVVEIYLKEVCMVLDNPGLFESEVMGMGTVVTMVLGLEGDEGEPKIIFSL